MPVTNIPTPGSPIRSNWAQSVSAVADAALARTGGTLTGNLFVGGDPATVAGHLLVTDGRDLSAVTAIGSLGFANFQATRRGSTGTPGAPGEPFMAFRRSASAGTPSDSTIGTITINATVNGVNYNTTSDRRLKDDLGPITDAVARIAALDPRRMSWRNLEPGIDVVPFDGLFADDVQAVAPYAVTGEPDAVDADGQIVPQQLDPGKLVPLLVAAVQALTARVAELESAR